MERRELTTKEMGTNTMNPQFGLFNLEQKKKPYDVKIKNFNPNEPKVKQSIKYTAKQSYRRYKTLTEPSLLSSIKIDDTDDMVNKIQKAFGIKPDPKRNFTEVETAKLPNSQGLSYAPPNSATVEPKLGGSIYYDEYADDDRAKIREVKRLIDEGVDISRDLIPEGSDEEIRAYMIESTRARIKKSNEDAERLNEEVKKLNEERLKAEVFEYSREILEDIIGEVTAESVPLDLSKPPEGGEEGLYDTEDDLVFDEDEPTPSEISAKTTEAPGSVALEAERAKAMKLKNPVGRPKKPETIEKERKLAEERERKRIAKEFGAES